MKKRTVLITTIIILIIAMSIIYNTLPRLQLNGSKNITMSYRQEYEEPGVIVKNANSKYMRKIKIDNNIDTKKIGNYYIDYSLKISGKTLHVRRNVKVIDDISPVIKLKGDQLTTISINKQYEEPGYTAQDEYDGDITQKVETIGEVDTKNYGEYVITYKVTDNSNNTTEVNRIVKVIDEEPPKILCKTEYSAFQTNSNNLIDCKAEDNFDGDISNKIKIIGEVDTTKPGIYKIKYTVKDDAGNKTEKEHKILLFKEKQNQHKTLIINTNLDNTIEQLTSILNENAEKGTFYFWMQTNNKLTEEYEKYIEKISEKNNEFGITTCQNDMKIYSDIQSFKNQFEKIQKELYEKTEIKIDRFKIQENINKLDKTTLNNIK